MRTAMKIVCIGVVSLLLTMGVAWSEQPEKSQQDVDTLCEIYSSKPITKTIAVNISHPVPIKPVVVHRCQEIIFEVDRGAAAITITDPFISTANAAVIPEEVGRVFMNTLILWVTEGHPGPAIRVPESYPNPEKTVFIPYPTMCFDLEAGEIYECEGSSAPIIIIPPTHR